MKRQAELLPLTFLFVACLRPDPSLIRQTCSAGEPCPDGQSCVEGICTSPLSDLAMPTMDAEPSDLAQAPPPDSAMVTGCAKAGGRNLGARAAACPGAFVAGGAAQQCASGWALCVTAAKVDLAAATGLGGFYAAEQPANWAVTMSNEVCNASVGNQLLYGVGTGSRAGTAKCGGFLVVMDLLTTWTSANGTLAQAINRSATDGVLCCQ
jgi:hypothetical protein